MLKTLTFLKRRPGMSLQAFQEYYENTHTMLGMRLRPEAQRYFRRYVEPGMGAADADFDVITEVWFADRTAFERTLEHLSAAEIAAVLAEDEEKLFDRQRYRLVVVQEELDSVLDAAPPPSDL